MLLFSDGLVDPATGESGVSLPPDLGKLREIAREYPSNGNHEWSVDPTGHGLLITNTDGPQQSEGFWYWKSWKQSEPVNVHPADGAQFKSDGWIWYLIYAADFMSCQYRLASTDDPDIDIVLPKTRGGLDASHDGTVVWIDNEQLVVSQVRDRALHELHRWDVAKPTWAKGTVLERCRLDSSGTWAALTVVSPDAKSNVVGLIVVNTSDGKIAWAHNDWCEVLWVGNAMFRCGSDSKHIAILSLGDTPHLTEQHSLPWSVTNVCEVSPDGRWALCSKRAPLFAPAISVGFIVLDMQTMRTYTGLSGFGRRCSPVGWLSGDASTEGEAPAK
jgi:hypothetical protein